MEKKTGRRENSLRSVYATLYITIKYNYSIFRKVDSTNAVRHYSRIVFNSIFPLFILT
jgi:hypothetical protein